MFLSLLTINARNVLIQGLADQAESDLGSLHIFI